MNHDNKPTEAVPPFASVPGYATARKLTKAQKALISDIASNGDAGLQCVTYYAPALALVRMGLAEWKTSRSPILGLRTRLHLTPAGWGAHNDEAERTAIADMARRSEV